MISDQFRKDYRQMTAKGVKFTPEDIVRLNALAVRIRLSQNAANTVHLPRLSFLEERGSGVLTAFRRQTVLILREPTIAHELWIEEASRWIDVTDDRNFLWLHGYALSQKAEKLVDAFDPKRLVKTVYRFAAKRLCSFTREQLSAAVEYVLFGANWMVGERGPESTKDEGRSANNGIDNSNVGPSHFDLGTISGTSPSPTVGLLVNARALRLPITLDDAKRMTASELEQAITRCLKNDDNLDLERARKIALKEYCQARDEIVGRSKRTREEAPSEPTARS